MSVVCYSLFVCISAYAKVYFKPILQECLRAGLPSGFPSTAPPPVLVLAVLGTLAVWIPNQKKSKRKGTGNRGDNTCQKKSRGTVQPRSRVFLLKSFLGQATEWGRNQ